MDVVHKISVDFGKEQIPQRISVMQNDSARKIEVSLYENGAVWNVPAGTSAYLAFRRPDGKNIKSISLEGGSPVVTFNENVATIQIPPELTFIDGDVPAVVVFVDANEKQIATFPTWVQVRENPSVESADDETIAPDQLTQILSAIAALKATVIQQTPLFANSVAECTDTTKMYVLPDGYIYAYTLGGGYTNLVPTAIDVDGSIFNGAGYMNGKRLNPTGAGASMADYAGMVVTGFIPVTTSDVIRMSGATWDTSSSGKGNIAFYDANFNPMGMYTSNGYITASTYPGVGSGNATVLKDKEYQSVTVTNGVALFNMSFYDADDDNGTAMSTLSKSRIAYVRISAAGNGADMVVTLNEEIAGRSEAGYAWRNTGHAFVPADYEDRIVALEEETEENATAIKELQQEVADIIDGSASIAVNANYEYAIENVLCIGDSLTAGVCIINNFTGSRLEQNYPYYLGRMLNCKTTNAGIGGISISGWYAENIVANKYNFADYDSAIIWLGTNSPCASMPTDEEITAFVPEDAPDKITANHALYLCEIIERIQTANPDCFILLLGIFTPWEKYETHNAVTLQIANKYGVYYVDMSDLHQNKVPELHGNLNDSHFGKAGNIFIASRISNFIRDKIADNPLRAEFGYGDGSVSKIDPDNTENNEPTEPTEPTRPEGNQIPYAIDVDGSIFNGAGYMNGKRLNPTGAGASMADYAGMVVTGFIPVTTSDVIRMSGATWDTSSSGKGNIAFYDANFNPMGMYTSNGYITASTYPGVGSGNATVLKDKEYQSVTVTNGVALFNMSFYDADDDNGTAMSTLSKSRIAYVRISAAGNGADMIVTINEEIT